MNAIGVCSGLISISPLFRARQKSTVRGAVSRSPVREKKSFDWSKLYSGIYVIGVVVIMSGAGYASKWLIDRPVSRVIVNGEFRQIDKQLIVKEVQPFIEAGFVMLDLDGIREQLTKQPWILNVEVTRQWPNEIAIFVEEQAVIARWGDKGFLNHRGQLLLPKKTKTQWLETERMPLLDGPEGSSEQVMNYFRQLNDALSQHGLVLKELTLNDRGSWHARLDNNVSLLLGSGDVMIKLRRFLRAYKEVLAGDFSRAKSIDMRYSRGFAVSWNKSDQQS